MDQQPISLALKGNIEGKTKAYLRHAKDQQPISLAPKGQTDMLRAYSGQTKGIPKSYKAILGALRVKLTSRLIVLNITVGGKTR